MDDDDLQQFSLRWHNHQNNVVGSLSRMLSSGTLTDVILNASGTSVKAHKIVLASCSQYFAQLFKEVESDGTLVVVLGCEPAELRLLLTFMYTGEVTASKTVLPSLLRLARTLKVYGLTDADTNSTVIPEQENTMENDSTPPINLDKTDLTSDGNFMENANTRFFEELLSPSIGPKEPEYTGGIMDFMGKSDKDRLSKLDQIVQNLYSTHKINIPTASSPPVSGNLETHEGYDRKWRVNSSVCGICNKRLSNQYNLRVHMETHAGRRHACAACAHVSRSRDALRKHVAYRHAPAAARDRDNTI